MATKITENDREVARGLQEWIGLNDAITPENINEIAYAFVQDEELFEKFTARIERERREYYREMEQDLPPEERRYRD